VARVEVTERAIGDLERLFDFITEEDPHRARKQLLSVRRAFELLADHPLLGREARRAAGSSSFRAAVTATSPSIAGFLQRMWC